MPDSQGQRPGGSLILSQRARLETLVQRAVDLEHRLSNLKKADEETAAGLRSHLCEVLSDIIISDPAQSCENDCTGKLWRNCFYAPIVVWRKKLSREKKKQGPGVKPLEQNFKKFLSEALTLYEYLVIQYQSKLLSTSSQGNLHDVSQGSDVASIDTLASVEGVVQGLFRLFIHMGDLNRYAESFAKAETYYLYAARLAPGMGNPYNQLAVVSQLKDTNLSCVALYWYCRSLLATHDAFETSNSNLERLFDLNRTYLEDHSRSEAPPIFPLPGNTKKIPCDILRAQKAATTKACLAHFVDFHFELFKESTTEEHAKARLREKMDGIMMSLDSLLHASAFGDSLLAKLVLINTFSIERAKSNNLGAKLQIARDFFMHFGLVLVERLRIGLAKIIEKPVKRPNSIRLLQPVGIHLEFMGNHDVGTDDSCLVNFWASVATVTSSLRRIYSLTGSSGDVAEPGELQMLKGYQPFMFLKPSYVSESPYVDAEEAICVLDLQPTQSQRSSKQAPKDENIARVTRMIKSYDSFRTGNSFSVHLGGNSVSPHQDRATEASVMQAFSDKNIEDSCSVAKYADITSCLIDDESDEAGDLVIGIQPEFQANYDSCISTCRDQRPSPVFQEPSVPAKLNALPLRPVDPEMKVHEQYHGSEDVTLKAMRPPPGFEGSTPPTFSQSLLTSSAASAHSTPLYSRLEWTSRCNQLSPSQITVLPGQEQIRSFAGTCMEDHNNTSTELFTLGTNSLPVLGQAEDLFNGATQFTHNPFYAPAVAITSNMTPRMPMYSRSSSDDDMSLLNIGLLESLWMESATGTSGNPFTR